MDVSRRLFLWLLLAGSVGCEVPDDPTEPETASVDDGGSYDPEPPAEVTFHVSVFNQLNQKALRGADVEIRVIDQFGNEFGLVALEKTTDEGFASITSYRPHGRELWRIRASANGFFSDYEDWQVGPGRGSTSHDVVFHLKPE